MTPHDVPQEPGTSKMRYVLFDTGWLTDVYLCLSPETKDWTFINRFQSRADAQAAIASYLTARDTIRSMGGRYD